MTKDKRFYLIGILAFCLANMLEFLLLFIPNYILEVDIGYAEYGRIFINKLIEFCIPPLAAILLFCEDRGLGSVALGGVGFSATRIIYLIPYYYLYFIDPSQVNYSYDSIEAIGLSLAVSVFGGLLLFGQIMMIFAIIRFTSTYSAMRAAIKTLSPEKKKNIDSQTKARIKREAAVNIKKIDKIENIFDLSSPMTMGIFCGVFGQFLIAFISESISTVEYFLSVSGAYRVGEIIYIMICYLFILAELIVVHTIGCRIVEKSKRGYKDAEDQLQAL